MTFAARRTLFPLVVAAALASALAAAGCQNMAGGDGSASAGKSAGAKDSFAAGKTVPSDAVRVREVSHSKLLYRTQNPKLMWVEDATSGKVVYSGPVRGQANIAVDPEANVVAVNDIAVPHAGTLSPDHTYRLYFKDR